MGGQELSVADRIAISDLYYNYSFLIDALEPEQVADLFTDDCVFELPDVEPLQGKAAIAAFVDGAKQGKWVMRHVLAGVVARPAEFGATGRSYLQAFTFAEDALNLLAFGEYNDDLVRTEDGWRFKVRRFTNLAHTSLTGRPIAEAAPTLPVAATVG